MQPMYARVQIERLSTHSASSYTTYDADHNTKGVRTAKLLVISCRNPNSPWFQRYFCTLLFPWPEAKSKQVQLIIQLGLFACLPGFTERKIQQISKRSGPVEHGGALRQVQRAGSRRSAACRPAEITICPQ